MPGKEVVGVIFEIRREGNAFLKVLKQLILIIEMLFLDEGVYESTRTTVFGLTKSEVATLLQEGFQITDKNPSSEGQEIETSGFNVSSLLEFLSTKSHN